MIVSGLLGVSKLQLKSPVMIMWLCDGMMFVMVSKK